MAEPNGGPAFPHVVHSARWEGMTLRDYFAAQALALNGEHFYANCDGVSTSPTQIAALAYAIADAMLAERAK